MLKEWVWTRISEGERRKAITNNKDGPKSRYSLRLNIGWRTSVMLLRTKLQRNEHMLFIWLCRHKAVSDRIGMRRVSAGNADGSSIMIACAKRSPKGTCQRRVREHASADGESKAATEPHEYTDTHTHTHARLHTCTQTRRRTRHAHISTDRGCHGESGLETPGP